MTEPPTLIDGAQVLRAAVSRRGGFYELTGGDTPIVVAAMAVAQYAGDRVVYLFKCDAEWNVVQDWDCESIDDAVEIAIQHSRGEPLVWLEPHGHA